MKRRILSICIALLSIFLLSSLAFAHPGKTDEDGGHYDYSTGEYHYHHGYPAHQHTGGQCPYEFDDRTGWNSGSSGSQNVSDGHTSRDSGVSDFKSEAHEKSSSSFRVFAVVLAALCAFVFVVRTSARIRHRREEKAKREQLTRDAKKLSAKLSELKCRRNELRSQLISSEVQPISELVEIPTWSFIGTDGLPHYTDLSEPDQDIYEFALNASTGVYHRPSCRYAPYTPKTNYVEILRNPHLRAKAQRPCSVCCPEKPPLDWYYECLDYIHALEILGVDEAQLHFAKVPSKLNHDDTFQYYIGSYPVTLNGVDSELISHIGYDQAHYLLYIRIRKSGRVYTYRDITPPLYNQFIHAKSIGRFYNQYIKRHGGSR